MVSRVDCYVRMASSLQYVVVGGMTLYLTFIFYYIVSMGLLDNYQQGDINPASAQDMSLDQDEDHPISLHRISNKNDPVHRQTPDVHKSDTKAGVQSTKNPDTIMILFANKVYERDIWSWTYGRGYHPFKKAFGNRPACDVSNCELTTDLSQLSTADAVFFSAWDWLNSGKPPLPARAGTNQVWVYFVHEPPIYVSAQIAGQLNDVFNVTMSYMLDADIPYPYVYTEPLGSQPAPPVTRNYAAGRSKPVLWIVSRCKTQSSREVYIEQLAKYIDVDIYGESNDFQLDRLLSYTVGAGIL